MNTTAYFVSDLHFGLLSKEQEDEREQKFVDFLYSIKEDANQLYILGDLFDYWFEYRRVIQRRYFRIFTALQDLVRAGVEINYIIGNHDFMHRDFFEREIGINVFYDPIFREINGKKFFVGHGDGLVKNDLGYLILKKILRNRFLQWLYSLIHPDFGIWLASLFSKTSRDYTTEKNYGKEDGLFDTAKGKIDEGFDYVLFGHTHVKLSIEYKHGRYINLGTWLARPCYGKFTNSEFEIIDWK